ncbi:response regulator, partial [Patescibacteria group bacterium]|nr:response regulator [Patescibacteria group bacterium]
VDDDEFIKILFKDIFWVHGDEDLYDVKVVSTIEEARRLMNDPETCPCILFLDLMLSGPKENFSLDKNESLKFLEEIKKDKNKKDITIVIFSGYGEKEVVKKAVELGADKFLVKGEFLPKDLIQLVDSFSAKKK